MSNIIQTFPKGSGGGHVVLDTNGTAVDQEKKLQFTGLDVSDDSTNEKTEVKAVGLNADSLNDIIQSASVQGNAVASNGLVYSTTEQIVGKWIDGKPLYQKTVGIGAESSTGMKTYTISIANTDLVMVDFSHSFQYRTSGTKEIIPISDEWDAGNTGGYLIQPSTNNFKFFWYRKLWNELPALITFQYTKTTDI